MMLTAEPGTRVALRGDHPWRGHSGVMVRWQTPYGGFGPVPVVKLDARDDTYDGQETFVMNAEQWGPESA